MAKNFMAVGPDTLTAEQLRELKKVFEEQFPGKKIVFSRHMLADRPDAVEDEDRHQPWCPRCQEPMLNEDAERVKGGDYCSDGLIYCLICLMQDQCGCLPVGA